MSTLQGDRGWDNDADRSQGVYHTTCLKIYILRNVFDVKIEEVQMNEDVDTWQTIEKYLNNEK